MRLCFKKRIEDMPILLSDRFVSIFQRNVWNSNESASGIGSTLQQTIELRRGLHEAIKLFNIKSLVDVPCGDANWMRHENFYNLKYLGIDIVPQVVVENTTKAIENSKVSFRVGDFTSEDELEKVDLVLTRDLFVHLNYKDIAKCLESFLKSQSTYLGLTTFHEVGLNVDLVYPSSLEEPIGWRPLNLELSPFFLGSPLFVIDEKCTERLGDRVFSDKHLVIYDFETVKQAYKKLLSSL
jgi:hypothetical protein